MKIDPYYKYDVKRIKKIFKEKGYKISKKKAYKLWIKYSNSMAAGWMFLEDDKTVFLNAFRHYNKNEFI